jgi:predicted alpha/beta superfamily hydrolase
MNKLILVFIFSLGWIISPAQSPKKTTAAAARVFPLGVIDEIQSVVLSEKRILNIYLPEGYSRDSMNSFPVIYLLDGSANEDFVHITGIVQFLNMIQVMPNTIVVGIANIDRRRDFTFPTSVEKDKKDYPTTGSSEKFISFIEKELQPYIQKKYSNNTSKTIIGQSLGGLLATETLLKKPTLFNSYIIVSPSLWWDNESLLAKAPVLLKALPNNNINVYISVGNEEKAMVDDAKKLADMLTGLGKKNLNVNFVPLPEEDHLTILHNSVYKAFRLLNEKK